MRHLKKYASLLLALVMALALAAPAFAANPDPAPDPGASGTNAQKGTITIDNAIPGQKYTIYKIFDVESYSGVKTGTENDAGTNFTDGNFSYKVVAAWADFFKEAKDGKEAGPGYAYIHLDEKGYIADVTDLMKNSTAEFAKAALAWAEKEKIGNQGEDTLAKAAEGQTQSTVVKFENVDLGYYLVDSTAGTLCSLNTTAPNVTIKEKNDAPSVKKEVMEVTGTKDDGTPDGTWGKKNDANIGDTVYFQTSISVKPGAQNYVLHDKMDSNKLAFGSVTGVEYQSRSTTTPNAVFTKVNDLRASDYEVENNPTDNHTFDVKFSNTWLNNLTFADDTEYQIVVSYTATVQPGAVIGIPETGTVGNVNETWLNYGDSGETTHDTTTTYVWEFDIFKYTPTKVTNNGQETTVETPLAGAKFTLSRTENGTAIGFVKTANGTGEGANATPDTYRVAVSTDDSEDVTTELVTPANGKIQLEGLDGGTYYLKEIEAPAGYNKLTSDVIVKITSDAEGSATGAASTPGTVSKIVTKSDNTTDTITSTDKVIKVENNTGAVLPSTGGIGTTIFYVVGGVLVVGAAILLVTKKRMSSR